MPAVAIDPSGRVAPPLVRSEMGALLPELVMRTVMACAAPVQPDRTWFLVLVGAGLVLRSIWHSLSRQHTSWLSTAGYLCALVAGLVDAPPPVVLTAVIVLAVGEFLHQTGYWGWDFDDELPEDLPGRRRLGKHRRLS